LTFGRSGAQFWAPERPNVKNEKWWVRLLWQSVKAWRDCRWKGKSVPLIESVRNNWLPVVHYVALYTVCEASVFWLLYFGRRAIFTHFVHAVVHYLVKYSWLCMKLHCYF